MPDTPVILTVIVPFELGEAVANAILARPDLTAGFSSSDVEGHGSSIHLVDAAELVRGYARRKRLETVCDSQPKARDVLDLLRDTFAGANMYYWMAPALACGRLT